LGGSDTIVVSEELVGDQTFQAPWQEADKSVVVPIEDYNNQTAITNISTLTSLLRNSTERL